MLKPGGRFYFTVKQGMSLSKRRLFHRIEHRLGVYAAGLARVQMSRMTAGYLRLAIRPRALSIAKIRYPSTTKATTIAPMKSATPPAPEMAGSRKV